MTEKNEKQAELLPCPFCGEDDAEAQYDGSGDWYVMCLDCLSTGPYRNTNDDATHEWNRRAALAQQPQGEAVASQSGEPDMEQVMVDLITHGISVQRIAPADFLPSQSAEPVALTQALQDIGYEFGCPVGIKITDWLRLRLAQPKAAIAAIRKVKESLDPDDWCGDESMIDVLERAESSISGGNGAGNGRVEVACVDRAQSVEVQGYSADGLASDVVPCWEVSSAASPVDQGGWQPIETAPKDGTEILLFRGAEIFEGKPVAERVTSGAWIELIETASEYHATTGEYLGQSIQGGEASWMSWDGGFREDAPPTHWMPLPPAPAMSASKEGA